MAIEFDTQNGIAYIRLTGTVSRDVILQALEKTVSDKRYKPGMARLWDFGKFHGSLIKIDDIYYMGRKAAQYPPGISDVKVAFVANDDLAYGLSRMYEQTAISMTDIGVFRTTKEAESWLCGNTKNKELM